MNVYTCTEARRELAALLGEASEEGAVRIQRRSGETFVLRPEQKQKFPFNDVNGVDTNLSRGDVVEMVREARKC